MPLHNKQPFERKKPPPDLRDNEEVFYCPLTKEIFRDYEEYCERIILCNSLVWSCSLTGRPFLTFEEALRSERNARQNLKDFPMELKVPVLYLATKTHRTSTLDLFEDIYIYVRDRYFVGETVEVCISDGTWSDAHVMQVIAPTEKQVASYSPLKNGEIKDVQRQFKPPASLFSYEVLLDGSNEVSELFVLQASQVRRKPRMYSRERSRLFLKQFLEPDKDGVFKVKESELLKYKIHQVKYGQIFAGNPPEFPSSKRAVKRQMQQQLLLSKAPKRKYTKRAKSGESPPQKKSRQETMQKYVTVTKKNSSQMVNGGSSSPRKVIDNSSKGPLPKVKRKRKVFDTPQDREAVRIKAIEDKQKRREDMLKQRAANREKKVELAKFIKEWNRTREDLECEDLKKLPAPLPVSTKMPNKLFGDMLMVLEFLHWFSTELKVKNFFPNGMTLELLERSLTEVEVNGPLSDVLQLLLGNLFEMQEDEEDALEDANPSELTERHTDGLDESDAATSEALRLATAAAAWSQTYQGIPLSKVVLDSVTLTEVLRLHLLLSGARAGEMSSEWRYRERGGYTTRDDPGLVFKMENPHILKSLTTLTIFELPPEDKLSILTCLINQILTYVSMRDVIEDRMEKTRVVRVELHYADREISKKEKEMVEESRKKRKKLGTQGTEEQKEGENNEESEAEEEKQETEEEKAARLARQKKTNNEKFKELQKRRNQLAHDMMGHTNLPIGSDRAHRRFWLFASLPGLFVENDERFAGGCLDKPTPHDLDLSKSEDTLRYVCKLFEEERNGGSDKENDDIKSVPSTPNASPSKKLLSEKNQKAGVSPLKSPLLLEDSAKLVDNHSVFLTCNANPDTCPVHSTQMDRPTWSFYTKDDLDDLIEHLSTRGIRESELRTALTQGKDRVLRSLEQCPVSKLRPDMEEVVQDIRKSQRQKEGNAYKDTFLGHPPGTSVVDVMDLCLRDLILDMEEKVDAGGLGNLKVNDRQAWRDTLVSRSYNKECEKLCWPGLKEENDVCGNSVVERIKSERHSRPGTPDSTASYSKDPSSYARLAAEVVTMGQPGIQPVNSSIRDLASAILQVSQSIDDRYLQKPLGHEPKEKEKKKEKKDDEVEIEKEKETGMTALNRWQISLMASTSYSQLYLHFSTLDNSIQWAKSALNASCKLCRRRCDPDQMLLCDGCNKGLHMYCLKPKLTTVPKGDWFCPTCKPKEKRKPEKKSRKILDDDDDDDDDDMQTDFPVNIKKEDNIIGPCVSCGEDESDLQCHKCNKCYHLDCADPPLRKVPRSKWMCEKCKNKSSARHSSDSSSGSAERLLMSRRRCAAKAIDNISRFAKRLRNICGDDEDPNDPDHELDDEDDDPEERQLHSRRRCAAKAVANISHFAKKLRSQNYDDNFSDDGSVSRRRSRRSHEVDADELPLDNAALQELLEDIIRHKDAWPFTRPVLRSEVPDYHTIIKRPMDFGTIKHKLNMLHYRNTSEVLADALLVFENCEMYNQQETDVFKSGLRLRKYFEKKCRDKNLKLKEADICQPDSKKKRFTI